MYLSNNEILGILNEYEKNPKKRYAILIDGDWGSGKTYFIKNQYIKGDKNKLYISLYGVKNKEEINSKIYYSILGNVIKDNKHKKAIEKAIEKAKKVSKEVGKFAKPVTLSVKNIFNIDLTGLEKVDVSSVISLFKDIKEYILVFDDLERCDIPINEVLGYINEYVEHKGAKVIIVANENEINKLNYDDNYELKVISCLNDKIKFEDEEKRGKETEKVTINKLKSRVEVLYEENKKYKAIKEKLVGFTIKYEPDISDIYEHIIKDYSEKNEELYIFLQKNKKDLINIMKVNQCKNIRTMVYIFDVFETIYNTVKDIINKETIIKLIFKNTIFCAIGLKKGIEIDKILNGSMCNVSVSLYEDRIYYGKSYFTAFDFVNDFIYTGKLDENNILKTIDYYNELKFDDLEEEDPFYYLQKYWVLNDQEIEDVLNKIHENIKKGIYHYKLFPKIINYLSRIEKLNFKVDLINEIVEEMINILKEKSKEVELHEFIEDDEVAKIYNKHIDKIKKILSENNDIIIENTIERVLKEKDWGINLYNFVRDNKQSYKNKKAFLNEFDIDAILNKIKESDSNNIYYFKYCLDVIYDSPGIEKYYFVDKENIEKLIKGIEELNQDSFGVTKKDVLRFLLKVLNALLKYM